MKISILGKILLLLSCISFSFANISTSVDKTSFYMGDSVNLIIKASGEDIKFPEISTINGYPVTSRSSSQQISIINGNTTKTKVMQYTFNPTKSITLQSFDIVVDNITFKTKQIHINKIQPTASKDGEDLVLSMKTNKKSYYIGEPIVLSLFFKHKTNLPIVDAKLDKFEPEGFWQKEMKSPQPTQINNYTSYQINHLLFAKNSGKITIPNQFINIAKRDYRNFINWEKVFSNKLELDIKPLPKDISIVGDFTIKASIDKNETNANEPINLTIKIEGSGNIEDINEFKLNMPNQVLYSSKPEIQSAVVKDKLIGEFTQKISIISDDDFSITPLEFSYFDLKSHSVKKLFTKSFTIKVNKTKQKNAPKIETLKTDVEPKTITKIKYVQETSYVKYIYALIGLTLGFVLAYLFLNKNTKTHKKDDTPLIKQIKKSKEDKELYNILLPYIKDDIIKKYINDLEKNIYGSSNIPIDKKALIEYLKEDFDI